MKNRKEELGRGIRALLEGIGSESERSTSGEIAAPANSVLHVPLEHIEVNPFQPRADFNNEKLAELANSIKIHGVIQPITLRRLSPGKYQLIAGERRLRATKMAGLKEIPAYIRQANDQEMLEIALIENIQRENLNAMEIAVNYKRLMEECELTQEQTAERVGKERSTVTNYLRLLKLPPDIQAGIKNGSISMGHARALINIDDVGTQLDVFKEIIRKKLSVRQVEELVRNLEKRGKEKNKKSNTLPAEYRSVQQNLTSFFGTKVKLKTKKDGKGEIVIPFFSDDDLNRLLELIDNE